MASSSSSFSKSKPQWIYDVFINFSGIDTRKSFVSHLYAALSNAGVNTHLDNNGLERGSELSELLRAIEGSQIAIVIFSKHYSRSRWCVDELAKIMKCRAVRGQQVLPVFYDVSPSLIRQAIEKSVKEKKRNPELHWSYVVVDGVTVAVPIKQPWMKAAIEACNLAGWDMGNYRNENTVVNEIVDAVLKKLDRTYLSIPDFAVGLESRAQHVTSFIRQQKSGVGIVGIWGMGGIGKTTVAKAIYNDLCHEFEDKSFLANIREAWETDKGKIDLQEQLLLISLKLRR